MDMKKKNSPVHEDLNSYPGEELRKRKYLDEEEDHSKCQAPISAPSLKQFLSLRQRKLMKPAHKGEFRR